MREELVIVDVHSGRLFSGIIREGNPIFTVRGDLRVETYANMMIAKSALKDLNVEKGVRLKIEKHYVKN